MGEEWKWGRRTDAQGSSVVSFSTNNAWCETLYEFALVYSTGWHTLSCSLKIPLNLSIKRMDSGVYLKAEERDFQADGRPLWRWVCLTG
jgi:hypothetical protein